MSEGESLYAVTSLKFIKAHQTCLKNFWYRHENRERERERERAVEKVLPGLSRIRHPRPACLCECLSLPNESQSASSAKSRSSLRAEQKLERYTKTKSAKKESAVN